MNRLTLRFKDLVEEARYLLSIQSIRKTQMRLALLCVGVLYCIVSALDLHFMPENIRHPVSVIHLSQGLWLCLFSYLMFRSASQKFHTVTIIATVIIAWNLNLAITIMGRTEQLFGEAYLMIIWTWMIAGLTLRQVAAVNLLFITLFEIAMLAFSPFDAATMVSHQFFIFVAVILGALGAYLTDFYRRQRFIILDKLSEQTSALMKLSQAVEQSGEAILITDNQGIIEYVNPVFTKITGYLPDEITGMTPSILKRDPQNAIDNREMWETITQGATWNGALIDEKKDGDPYPVLISVAPIQDTQGNITHYVVTQKDMTEHQQLEDQLRHAQKMEAIGTLVGGIAHDFNNTLAGVTGNVYLAKQSVQYQPDTLKLLDRIESLALRSGGIVKQLLAFSRKGIVQMQTVNAASLLTETAKLYEVTLPENIRFDYQLIGSDDMHICGDPNQIEQVIFNLLNNARDAVVHAKEPEIFLQLERWKANRPFKKSHPAVQVDTFARISVVDNGCGIEEEALEHIFEPFYTTKAMHEGTGLGLSMAYGAAQSHGGAITAESKPGVGTNIRLYLPLIESRTVHAMSKPEEVVAEGSGATILLADDNEEVLEMATAVLEDLGYSIVAASDGAKAVDLYKAHRDVIQLAILDVVMPKMDGIEASKAIREINPTAKVIFLTGYEPNQEFNDQEMSTETIMMKPFKVTTFSQLVKATIEC